LRTLRSHARGGATAAAVVSLALVAAACGSSKATTSPPTTAGAGAGSPTTVSPTQVPAKYAASGLNVAMDATYPPDEFVQGGQIVGFDADLIKAIAQTLNVKATLVNATFATIIPGLLDGKYDVGNSSFTDNKTREQQVDFVTYYSSGEGYYVNASSTATFNGLASLCGHSVAVESGTTEQTDAETQAKMCHVTVLTFADQNQANLAVSSGRAQVGFLDSQVAGYVVSISHGQFKLVGTPFSTAPYGFALPKNSGLAPPFLAAVKTLMANGTYIRILTKWGAQAGAITNPQINGAAS
jgi:polar amino acid transport system substrate-binding protein